ncbi:MAG: GHKL domain-containing protein [candidate division Zixibacteria bacterium]|nr:GHKL domain-containing protein [candidate division Zixibacteria bacterium]
MAYRFFRLNCILRVVLLATTILIFVYMILKSSLIITSLLVGVFIIIQVLSLIHYIEKTNRDLAAFLASIKYSDYSSEYNPGTSGKSFRELNAAFKNVFDEFRRIRSEKEEQYHYLQTVVQHIGLGILAFDQNGEVDLINSAARQLLRVNHLKNINSLRSFSEQFYDTLVQLKAGDKKLVKIENGAEPLKIAVYATKFRRLDRVITLVSMQNIESELAEQEMESWQKLIRVLTHEIMNSVTPIASLASTVSGLITKTGKTEQGSIAKFDIETIEDIHQAAATIEKRSRGLLGFIDAYRNLTRIPTPNFQIIMVSELFGWVEQLMRNQLKEKNIKLEIEVEPQTLELAADRELIEQVIINMILNAIHALDNIPDAKIKLKSRLGDNGRTIILVSDNGIGIDEEVKEKIFLPFFTTKKEGAGIGLSLSRQIMRLHKGNITVLSEPGTSTTFSLIF